MPINTKHITKLLLQALLAQLLQPQATSTALFPSSTFPIETSSLNTMVKQKVVIKVSMNGQKSRSRALKIAVGLSGVEAAGFQGEEKDQIEVTGEGFDAVGLTTLLRKGVGHAEIVSVGPVKEKKEEASLQPIEWAYQFAPHYPIYEFRATYPYQYQDPYCSIM